MAADDGLEGTWGGASGDLTAQVIVTGGEVIGFYWRGDYVDAAHSRIANGVLGFDFPGGHATLTRLSDGTARLEVTESSRMTRMILRRD